MHFRVLAIACTVADDPSRAKIWPLAAHAYQSWVQRLRERLPIRAGSFKWIRRAAATATARVDGREAATRALGHTSAACDGAYLDWSQIREPVRVPTLDSLRREIS